MAMSLFWMDFDWMDCKKAIRAIDLTEIIAFLNVKTAKCKQKSNKNHEYGKIYCQLTPQTWKGQGKGNKKYGEWSNLLLFIFGQH